MGAGNVTKLFHTRHEVVGAGNVIITRGGAVSVASFRGFNDIISTNCRAIAVVEIVASTRAAPVTGRAGIDGGVGALRITIGGSSRQLGGCACIRCGAFGWAISVTEFPKLKQIVSAYWLAIGI